MKELNSMGSMRSRGDGQRGWELEASPCAVPGRLPEELQVVPEGFLG